MHIKLLPIALSCMIASSPAYADQTKPNVDATSRADALLKENEKPGHPGCAVGVYQNGETLYEGAYGLANVEHGVPIDPQRTVFNIASVSKQFTAASILLLVQDGKLKLDDDIRKYLPEIPDYGHTITIEHLLHHTSGLRDYTELWWFSGNDRWGYADDRDALKAISNQQGLDFTPGSKHAYSNTGYLLMSLIVQKVSGKTLAEFAKERIFSPLGMKTTYFKETLGRVTPHIASGYALGSDNVFQTRSSGWTPYGDTGLHTTVGDLAKWQRNFDEPKVGGGRLIRQLEQKGVLNSGKEIEYARGLQVYDKGYRGIRTVRHEGGTWDGYRADLMRLPSEKFSIAVLCNSNNVNPIALGKRLADIYMEGKFPKPAQDAAVDRKPEPAPNSLVPISEDHLKLLGVYWNREDMSIRRIERSDGNVWYVRSPESRSELAPIANGQFLMLGVQTRVVIKPMPSDNDRNLVQVASETPAILEKVEPFSSATNALDEFAGTYTNHELDARWTFVIKDGKLTGLAPIELENLNPVFKDAFLDGYGAVLLVFQRDGSGRVTSLLVDTVRIRNMTFTRVSE
jgi:CubicO group peptidase (beta-lactamase class C family)